MFSFLIIACIIRPHLVNSANGTNSDSDTGTNTADEADKIYTEAAIARFFNNDIYGHVVIYKGHINISLDFSLFDFDSQFYAVNGEECFKGGIDFGIYTDWTHDDDVDKLLEDCGTSYTSNRWDPWLACSHLSSNSYCESSGNSDACVPYGGVWNVATESEYSDDIYICDEYNYVDNPFVCEVGDLSGKYGRLEYDSDDMIIEGIFGSPFETDGKDLGGMSIVFRCHDTYHTRAFCAPFESLSSVNEYTSSLERLYQNESRSDVVSKRADFGSSEDASSYIYLSFFGKYEIVLNSNDIGPPGDCGTALFYRIFDDSNCGDSDSDNIHFYDPTLTCKQQSNMFNLGYCEYIDDDNLDTSEGYRCDNNDYSYSSDYCTNYFSLTGFYRWYCSPSDLSGKYGTIDISSSTTFSLNYSGYDDLMIPLQMLAGKSVGVQCSDTYAIIECATFYDYTDDEGQSRTDSDSSGGSDDDSGGSSGSNSDDTILGINSGLFWFVLLLSLLTIIPCVKYYKSQQAKKAEQMEKSNKVSNIKPNGLGPVTAREQYASAGSGSHGSASRGSQRGSARHSRHGSVSTSKSGRTQNTGYGDNYSNYSGGVSQQQQPQQQQQQHGRALTIQERAALARQNKTQPQLGGGLG